ncbi:hypothetical protein [Vibrio cyclitrophicus]|uniref:hypothetical protein n=1 Tax=Vibrio cyclitrophicus TaxID=47951 RepID=UPI001054DC0E|nr:hypothetical protein [Vibrio cyclitrophicus]
MFVLGCISTELFPKKIKFSNSDLPPNIEECVMTENVCESNTYDILIEKGTFSPLEVTEFQALSDKGFGELNVTSDDQRFGTITAVSMGDNRYSAMIPYCSNTDMRIIIYFESDAEAIKFPVF